MQLPEKIKKIIELDKEVGKYVETPYNLNRVFLDGKIIFLDYRLVDRGPIYAMIFMKIEASTMEEDVVNGKKRVSKKILNVVARDYIADYIFQHFKVGRFVNIFGHLRQVKRGYVTVVEDIEWIKKDYYIIDFYVNRSKHGKVDKKCLW